MSQIGASLATDMTVGNADDDITAQAPVSVYSCNRLGRVANPPSFSFADLFRPGRRR